MSYYKIPKYFKDEHPLPEGYEWRDEDLGCWPGIFCKAETGTGRVSLPYYAGHYEEQWEPSSFSAFSFDKISFNTAEEALHYGYTLFMLGCFQE